MAEDRDILAALDQRFADLTERFDRRFERVDQRFTDLTERFDRRFEQIDQRFEKVDQRFEQIDQRFEQIDQRFEQIDQRFESVEQEIRHAHVKIEAQSGEIRQLAEGVAAVDHKLEEFRADVARRFDETHSLFRLSYGQLEQRLTNLERGYHDLDARLAALEGNRH